ncbi:hypothetical protein Tco_0389586 [Tanacetum coccineum]
MTLYHALMESILMDEDAMDQGVADLDKQKKRNPADGDRDEDLPAGSEQGLKKRKISKDAESSKNPKSTGSSKDTTQSQPKSTSKSAQAKETIVEAKDTDMPLHQGDDLGNADEQPNVEADPKQDWFKKPTRPPTPDLKWNTKKLVDDGPTQNWLNDLANAEKPPLTFDDLMSTPIDFHAFAMNRLNISKLTKADLVGTVYNLLKGTCKSCVELEYNIEECYWALSDQLDWNNPEGNHCPYDLSKPLPLQELKNLKGDVIVDLAVALCMYTRRIIIQKRVEDLQLGVESHQKKLNISKPRIRDEYLSRRAPYTTLLEPLGVIYEDKLKRKRLMCTDEIYKFSDGTLTSVCNTLDQMLKNLRLGYYKVMKKQKWTITDQKRTRIMIKDIKQQLLERRIMRSLEKFVGGRDYETDYRLLQRTV